MTGFKTGLITLSLNDMSLCYQGKWYHDTEEFQIGELAPSKHNYWALPGLTYPLKIDLEDGTRWRGRVFAIPTEERGGVRFKVYHDPLPKGTKGSMSPSVQRLADLLEADKAGSVKYMQDVFSMAGKGKVRLGEITNAVKAHLEDGLGKPTPRQALDRIKKGKVARKPKPPQEVPPEQPAGRVKRRKHVSVWEIRN